MTFSIAFAHPSMGMMMNIRCPLEQNFIRALELFPGFCYPHDRPFGGQDGNSA